MFDVEMNSTETNSKASTQKPENGFLNLFFNILIPVLILNRGSKFIGPLPALIIALMFPLGYGIYDLIKRRKMNAFSVLGLLNVGITGTLAVLGLHGIWFSVKEAAFPLLVGCFVLGSAFTRKPFIETLFLNPAMMDVEKIFSNLQTKNTEAEFHAHMKRSTIWLSLSFVFSATLNFILAQRIFLPIDSSLPADQQSILLNEQIAQMTTWSMAVIMVPSVLFLLLIFGYLLKGIRNYTGMTTDEIILQK